MKALKINIISSIICAMILPFNVANAVGIKENSIITSNVITLGDVFYDLPRGDDKVLGNAPNPNKDMVLNARTLLRIAMAMDLPWRPASNSDKVTLRRAATVIEYDQIKETIYTALYEENIYGDYEINIPSQYHKIILPYDQPASMAITNLSLDASRKKFEVTIVAPSAENPIQQFNIKGQIQPVITVPVLSTNVQHGRTIQSRDIEYVKIKERAFSRDTIADASQIIGMTARRMIIAGRPIKQTDITATQIIKRGSLVMLSLNSGAMSLTTQVKALENGAKGDVIRVVNTLSNKTLQAIVTGDNEVAVMQN